jgi:hypothetical protein
VIFVLNVIKRASENAGLENVRKGIAQRPTREFGWYAEHEIGQKELLGGP